MATVPTQDTYTVGEVVTAAKLNKNVRDMGAFHTARPMCQISATAATTAATSGTAVIAVMATTDYDTDSMADLANNRIVIKTAGLYRITGNALWAVNATGTRYTGIRDAAGAVGTGTLHAMASAGGGATGVTGASVSRLQRFAVNDTIRLELTQHSGASLATASPFNQTFVSAEWVGA